MEGDEWKKREEAGSGRVEIQSGKDTHHRTDAHGAEHLGIVPRG